MDYDCFTVSMDKILLSPKGVVEPLCNSCGCYDCTNPIRKVKVSVQGIKKEFRLYSHGTEYKAVVKCDKGYINKALLEENDEE